MNIAAILPLIENPLSYPEGKHFAAILGAAPSKGARSPALWNAAFKAHGIAAEMLPMDILAGGLHALLTALDAAPDFLGGAVAMPHKEAIAQWLGERLTPEAKAIGAVNCLYRNAEGRLMGTNTDGEGALVSCKEKFGALQGKSVLLLGTGGAGKAVAAYMASAVGAQGRLVLASRSEMARDFATRLKADWLQWGRISEILPEIDVLVNCTSVGTGQTAGQTPLSREQLAELPSHAAVFDIIYQPSPSALLEHAAARGLQTLDGSVMNLEQAILGFGHANAEPNGRTVTRAAMSAAKRVLDGK